MPLLTTMPKRINSPKTPLLSKGTSRAYSPKATPITEKGMAKMMVRGWIRDSKSEAIIR